MNRRSTLAWRAALAAAALAGSWIARAAPLEGAGGSPVGAAAPHAQPTAGILASDRRPHDTLSRAEREFVMRAAEAGRLEVRAARLAVVRSRSPVVQKIATGYVMAHTAAHARLARLADRWGIELPIAAPRVKRRELERLARQKGADFDLMFIRVMGIREHEEAIALFESARGEIRHPALRAWLDETLPALRRHLAQARDAADGRVAS